MTDGQGAFHLTPTQTVQWVTARHPRFLPRTRAAIAGSPVLLRLSPDDGETISLQFGGDVMFGRRFYDRDEDGSTLDGRLRPGGGVAAHQPLLRGVAPLLGNADITAVNLETPLISNPYYNPLKPRPERFHATKDFAFASAPEAAQALRRAGVDVLDLGNNHLFDARERGIRETLTALHRAGFASGSGHFGAGRTEAERGYRRSLVSADARLHSWAAPRSPATTSRSATSPPVMTKVARRAARSGGWPHVSARCAGAATSTMSRSSNGRVPKRDRACSTTGCWSSGAAWARCDTTCCQVPARGHPSARSDPRGDVL